MGAMVQLTAEQRKMSNRVIRGVRLMQRKQQKPKRRRQNHRDPPPTREGKTSSSRHAAEDEGNHPDGIPAADPLPLTTQEPTQPPIAAPELNQQPIAALENRPMYFAPMPPVPIFKGGTGGKHPVKFIGELENYFRKMNIPAERQLEIVNESLMETAQDWAAIFKESWATFADFRKDFLESYWSEQEQNKLRHNITTTRWSPATHRTMEAHFAYYIGLARMLTKPIPDDILMAELIKHFPVQIQSLWTLKIDRTIASAAEFLRQQENILGAQVTDPSARRFRPYQGVNLAPRPQTTGNDHRSSQ